MIPTSASISILLNSTYSKGSDQVKLEVNYTGSTYKKSATHNPDSNLI